MAAPPFNPNQSVPADNDVVSIFPNAERLFRDIIESWLLMEHDATTGRHAIPVDTTANLSGLSFPTNGGLAWDTTTGLFQVRVGSSWKTVGFPSGTRMLFNQTAAPVGWTKETNAAYDNVAVRLVTGALANGGTQSFTNCFASSRTPTGTVGATALTTDQLPSHFHLTVSTQEGGSGGIDASNFLDSSRQAGNDNDYILQGVPTTANTGKTSSTGSGNTHTHSLSMNTLPMDVLFRDCIVAQKD